jgi:UDP-2-acetamido-3-amino-2,3-dideoxy-glucuronate N-acetyltransferase
MDHQIIKDCTIGKDCRIWHFVNLYGCVIGDKCLIGSFVEIQAGVVIGDRVRIESHTFIPTGIKIGNDVFIGHHVVFINDNHPTSDNAENSTWILQKTIVKKGAVIGSNATILGGLIIGENAVVGAGAVVTKNVPDRVTIVGNPAKKISQK